MKMKSSFFSAYTFFLELYHYVITLLNHTFLFLLFHIPCQLKMSNLAFNLNQMAIIFLFTQLTMSDHMVISMCQLGHWLSSILFLQTKDTLTMIPIPHTLLLYSLMNSMLSTLSLLIPNLVVVLFFIWRICF